MISSLRGAVLHVGLGDLVVEVGGVGLLIHTTPTTTEQARTGQTVLLSTSLVVREESLTLYGFSTPSERDLFEQVQTVSGVGPRLALAMLSVHEPDSLRAAISTGDLAALTRIPGIGKKGAERIVLELRDKIGPIAAPTPGQADTPNTPAENDQVLDALVGLGWNAKQAESALARVADAEPELTEVSAVLRAALRELSR